MPRQQHLEVKEPIIQADLEALPNPKRIGQILKKVGASMGEVMGNAYHASINVVRSLAGRLTDEENLYYRSVSPDLARSGRWFLHGGFRKSFVDSLEHIPEDSEQVKTRRLYVDRVVSELIRQDVITKKEDMVAHAKGFRELYDAIPKDRDEKRTFAREPTEISLMAYSLGYLVGSGIIKKPEDWQTITKSLRHIEGGDAKTAFLGFVLPGMKASKAIDSAEGSEQAARGFSKCANEWEWGKENRPYWLLRITKAGIVKDETDWDNLKETVKGIPKEWLSDTRTRKGYGTFIGRTGEAGMSMGEVRKRVDVIKRYAAKHGDKKMIWKTGGDNLIQGIPEPDAFPRAMRFEKDDSGGKTVDDTLLPLSGRATGIFFRKMDPDAYRAWARAQVAGVPCEEILTRDRHLTRVTADELETMDVRSLTKKLNVRYIDDIAKKTKNGSGLVVGQTSEGEKSIRVQDDEGKTILVLKAKKNRHGDYDLSVKTLRAKKTHDGHVRVACRYGGTDLVEFFADKANEKHKPAIEKQVGKLGGDSGLDIVKKDGTIPTRLKELGIKYGPDRHMHAYNFVVEMKDDKPLVKIIDFDSAKIEEK